MHTVFHRVFRGLCFVYCLALAIGYLVASCRYFGLCDLGVGIGSAIVAITLYYGFFSSDAADDDRLNDSYFNDISF